MGFCGIVQINKQCKKCGTFLRLCMYSLGCVWDFPSCRCFLSFFVFFFSFCGSPFFFNFELFIYSGSYVFIYLFMYVFIWIYLALSYIYVYLARTFVQENLVPPSSPTHRQEMALAGSRLPLSPPVFSSGNAIC